MGRREDALACARRGFPDAADDPALLVSAPGCSAIATTTARPPPLMAG